MPQPNICYSFGQVEATHPRRFTRYNPSNYTRLIPSSRSNQFKPIQTNSNLFKPIQTKSRLKIAPNTQK